MARLIASLFLLSFAAAPLAAQQFKLWTDTPISGEASDSRSVNIIDVNGDGLDDVFISNGPKDGANNELYINQGEGSFARVLDDPIVNDGAKSDGATFADIDNDGDLDAYVVTWYGDPNNFYLNNGDGTFSEASDAGVNAPGSFAETASFGDFNGDGFVDLFVSISGGRDRSNLFFQNTGKGSFVAIEVAGLTDQSNTSRSVNWVDVDNDFDLDLFVANENAEDNGLYLNTSDPAKPFVPRTSDPVTAFGKSSISGSWGDVDNDGDLDLFVANSGYFKELNNQLFLNDGKGRFTEVVSADCHPVKDGGCSYGSAFGDVDNDGDLDLLVTNGFSKDKLEDRLYENLGGGKFERWEDAFDVMPAYCSFGTAMGDLNQDGFLDIVIAHCNNNTELERANSVFLNEGNNNHWITVGLEGETTNRSVLGARVQLTTRSRGKTSTQTRMIDSQSGYCGQSSLRVHFGLGKEKEATELRILWPNGKVTILENLEADRHYQFLESEIPEDLSASHYLEFFPERKVDELLVKAYSGKEKVKEAPRLLLQNENGLLLIDDPLESLETGEWIYRNKTDLDPGCYLLRIECGKKTYLQRMYF